MALRLFELCIKSISASNECNGRDSHSLDAPALILANPHDIIKFFPTFIKSNIYEFRRLYESGRSLKEISDEHGIARSSVRDQLTRSGVDIRPSSKIRIETDKKLQREHWGAIPYDHCIVDRKLVIHPYEIKNVRKILGQWQTRETKINELLQINPNNAK